MIAFLSSTQASGAAVRDLLVILVAAALVAIVLQRIRLAVIPGYLITGALVGPLALRLVPSTERLEEISHLAIVLLMFGIGLQLHVSALKHRWARMLVIGLGACLVSVLAGVPLARAFGLAAPEAIAISMALSLSSTAVVLRILAERRKLSNARGRLCLAILVVQDVAVLAMLAAVPTLAEWAGSGGIGVLDQGTWWQGIGGWKRLVLDQTVRFGGVVALILLFRIVAPLVLRESLRGRSLETLTIASLAVALSLAVAVQRLGFSVEMGAFLAGFLLAGTPFRPHLSGQIRPLRDLLIAVFFTTVGMKLDPRVLAHSWWLIGSGVLLLITLKAVVIASVCWTLGATGRIAVNVGVSLAQAGEFSLVFLDLASYQGVLSAEATQVSIGIVVVSLVLTPALTWWAPRLAALVPVRGAAPWFGQSLFDEVVPRPDSKAEPGYVVVAGYGLVGCCIVDNLEKEGYRVTVVEINHETVRRESRAGRSFVFGDIASESIIDCVGIDRAAALVLTIPDDDAVQRACALARRRRGDLEILARTALVSRCRGVHRAGASAVAVDEMACADAMLGMVMSRLKAPDPESTCDDADAG